MGDGKQPMILRLERCTTSIVQRGRQNGSLLLPHRVPLVLLLQSLRCQLVGSRQMTHPAARRTSSIAQQERQNGSVLLPHLQVPPQKVLPILLLRLLEIL